MSTQNQSIIRSTLRKLSFVLFVVSAVGLMNCTPKNKADETVPGAADADENVMGDSDHGQAMGLVTVNFGYDSFLLDSSAKNQLNANAAILKDKASVNIQVEGHCDERGGIQYNLALGEKRARAVKSYLVDKGISSSRIEVISFGKERPIDPASNEEAWAKNRRANFVITSR